MESQQGGERGGRKAERRRLEMSFFIVMVTLTLKDGGINMSRASSRKHSQESKRDLLCVREIHNVYCIIPSALYRIQFHFLYSAVTGGKAF